MDHAFSPTTEGKAISNTILEELDCFDYGAIKRPNLGSLQEVKVSDFFAETNPESPF